MKKEKNVRVSLECRILKYCYTYKRARIVSMTKLRTTIKHIRAFQNRWIVIDFEVLIALWKLLIKIVHDGMNNLYLTWLVANRRERNAKPMLCNWKKLIDPKKNFCI